MASLAVCVWPIELLYRLMASLAVCVWPIELLYRLMASLAVCVCVAYRVTVQTDG